MPPYVNIQNNLPASLSVYSTVSPSLGSNDWGVDSNSPPSKQTTRVLWMNHEAGIHDGEESRRKGAYVGRPGAAALR